MATHASEIMKVAGPPRIMSSLKSSRALEIMVKSESCITNKIHAKCDKMRILLESVKKENLPGPEVPYQMWIVWDP
jgi:hypothetical protein